MYNKYSRLTEIHRQQTLEKFGGKASKDWTEEEKRKDRKALSSIHFIYLMIYCKNVCRKKLL
jgi:hypothetical protein